jgi:hypothetical protein
MRRVLDFLRTDDLPTMSRPNYVTELRQITLWGIVAGTVEGNMVGVVAAKTFAASDLLTTIVWALPILMNVLNVVWGTVLRGRRRKQAFFTIATCGLIAVSSVALTASTWHPWGGYIFAAQIAATHLFLSALITLRTTMWKVNYPSSHRARIAGRLQTVRMLLTVLTSAGLSLAYDQQPELYRVVYPTAALIGFASLVPFRKLRMRGERHELREFRAHLAQQATVPGDRLGLLAGLREAGVILRTDTLFAKYMLAQFLLGAANFFSEPILVNALTKDLGFKYFHSLTLLYLVPMTVMLVSIRFWAPLFDQVGVLRFRVHNGLCWTLSYVFVAAGMLLIAGLGPAWMAVALAAIVVGRILRGLGRGGGAIAWNIGHLHFAGDHQTELYMGIHVGLTGLRALLMPLLGYWACRHMGYAALLIAVAFAVVAYVMFRRLAADDGAKQRISGTPGPAEGAVS